MSLFGGLGKNPLPRIALEVGRSEGYVKGRLAFLEAMGHLRQSRLRTGGTSWELYRDGEKTTRFVELFRVPSWEEHLRQHAGRLTETDRCVEEAALAYSDPPAYADHLLPP